VAQISIADLTVDFAVYDARARSLKSTLMATATGGRVMADARDVVKVRALDHVSLEIRAGDRIALVGHNGSGKTTLLRVLAGIYKPSGGKATLTGRVGTILDPMAGIDHDATGLENIYLRGLLLGMSKREITGHLAAIAAFADLGDFLQLPMRTYSAGMQARLIFGVTTCLNNDILLLDEGIGAGDAEFQQKAWGRIEQMFDQTPIVLLATHSEDLIQRFCNRRIQLEHGRIVSDEPVVRAEVVGAAREAPIAELPM
jgi:ABC-type polysaccharide/polyol phosphate transport system ATPase subunit